MLKIFHVSLLGISILSSVVFADNHYSYEIVARTGVPIADLGSVADLGQGPSINDAGKVAFIARDQTDLHGRILLKNQDNGAIKKMCLYTISRMFTKISMKV